MLHILAEAIANAQSTDATAIRDALANTKNFEMVFNTYKKLGEIMPHYSIEKREDFTQKRDLTEEGIRICTNQIEGFWVNIKRA